MNHNKLYTTAKIAIFLAGSAMAGLALAAAPMAGTPAPGFFRMMLGDFEVTALSDGTEPLPVDQLMRHATPAKVNQLLAKSYLASPLETSFNAFLINTGSKLVLIDTGSGTMFGKTLNKLQHNLKASGYQPEQVDEIYLTHMHSDHEGGLSENGAALFPNAVVRAEKHESDFWLNPEHLAKARPGQKADFNNANSALAPYLAAGKYQAFDGDVELIPGISSQLAAGHTAGHSVYVVQSKGQKLVLVGDLVHFGPVQFADPSITTAFDSNSKSADQARTRLLDDASKAGYLIGAAHLQFPGLGRLRKNGGTYQWIPVNYTQMH
ncbi:MBL fold metallo-hydrolase [Janthinobacterium agaricidamnosum]|uniref:Methyl parathion hydrolase n=1 Tax=Janthinobacterium agaricidamnosum NBRC 102515 = DSM 9628 TaxID=1349767 RepID=W0V3V0_9BURK|nr:MBL fold metallo-hydrolase [Janthinobacterium agaricidamnosum]CDG83499.1 methyl parathion hydrolase [Janthinobacterium agaricidamnosum NBRC 102515 = DSM 9628]